MGICRNCSLGPLAGVVPGHAVDEEEEGGVALHAVRLRQLVLLRGVHLGQRHVDAVCGEGGRGGGVVGRERAAVAAPGRVELDHDVAARGEDGGEVGGGEEEHVGLVDIGVGGVLGPVVVVAEEVLVFVVGVEVGEVRSAVLGVVGGGVVEAGGERGRELAAGLLGGRGFPVVTGLSREAVRAGDHG